MRESIRERYLREMERGYKIKVLEREGIRERERYLRDGE